MAPIRPILRDAGLTEQQWRVLRVLVDEGDSDPSGLAQAGLLYPPTVTRIHRDLVDRGLLVRRQDPEDGRRWLIAATPVGRALVESTASRTAGLLEEYANRFGPERLQALQDELAALVRRIGPLSGNDRAMGGED